MTKVEWSEEWREVIDEDEPARFEAFAKEICSIARDVSRRTQRPAGRVFHLKRHSGVTGVLRVLPDLPEPLANGVFKAAREIPCYVRFSNGAVLRQCDWLPDVRGVGLKLVGVYGERLDGGDDVTQDFLFVQAPAVPTDSFEEFLALARASVGGPLLLPLRMALAVGIRATFRVLLRLALVKQPRSLGAATYYTAVPMTLGPAAMKLSLAPKTTVIGRRGKTLREDLVARLRERSLTWMLRAQLFTDEQRTPIESAATEWRGAWHDVAELTVPRQDIESAEGRAVDELVEGLAFNPWHGLADHRPLGRTQRARAAAYRSSAANRGAHPEPRTVLPHG